MAAQLRGNLTKKMEDGAGKVHFRRWKAMSIGARISLVVLVAVVLVACLANFIAPHDPLAIYTARQAPDAEFLFGTDDKGRDVLSRMMYGARYSLTIGLGATAFALVCGSIIGSLAAVSRKWISEVIMRILDIIMSFPGIALAATFVIVFGNNLPSLIFAIGFLYIPQIARIVRANIVSEYATLPTRFGLGTARGYASLADGAQSRAAGPRIVAHRRPQAAQVSSSIP